MACVKSDMCGCERLSRISGMEYWNGMVEWNTGMTCISQMFDKYHPPLSKYRCYIMHQLHASDLPYNTNIVHCRKLSWFSWISYLLRKFSSESFIKLVNKYCMNDTTTKVFPRISTTGCNHKSFTPCIICIIM